MGSDMQQRDPGQESNPGPLQSLRHMGRARYRLSYAAYTMLGKDHNDYATIESKLRTNFYFSI